MGICTQDASPGEFGRGYVGASGFVWDSTRRANEKGDRVKIVGTAVGSDPLYGTVCRMITASSGRSKILPTASACFLVICICPRQAAVVHSLEAPTFLATSAHLMPLVILRKAIRSVQSWRFIGLPTVENEVVSAASGSRSMVLLL